MDRVSANSKENYPLCAARDKGWKWLLEFRLEMGRDRQSVRQRAMGPTGVEPVEKNKLPLSFSTCPHISWLPPRGGALLEGKGQQCSPHCEPPVWCNAYSSATQGMSKWRRKTEAGKGADGRYPAHLKMHACKHPHTPSYYSLWTWTNPEFKS